MSGQIVPLVFTAIDTAVKESCRWESPYFAQARLKVVLEQDLFNKIDQLLDAPLTELAAHLHVAACREAVKIEIHDIARQRVDDALREQISARRGWKPLLPRPVRR